MRQQIYLREIEEIKIVIRSAGQNSDLMIVLAEKERWG